MFFDKLIQSWPTTFVCLVLPKWLPFLCIKVPVWAIDRVLLGLSTSQSHDAFPNLTKPLGCLKRDPILTSREMLSVAISCFVSITISAPIVEILINQASSTFAFSWENI